MKRNSIILAFFLSFFAVGIPSFAQDATAILKEYNERFDMLKDFTAAFVYSIENPSKPLIISKKGKLQYANGKYALIMDDQEIYCDGISMWVHLPGDAEVNIMDYDPEEGFGLEKVFSSYYGEGFKARYEDKRTVGGVSYDQIYIEITNPEQDFNQAMLWINETTKFLEKVVLTNRIQIITTYAFSNIKMDQGLPESTFVFDMVNFRGEVYDER